MMTQHLFDRIKRLKKLTPSELRLSNFFFGNATEMVFENVTTLAQKTGVSKATVVRFVAKLGYASFADLRAALQADARVMFESPTHRYPLKKQEIESSGDIFEQNVASIIKNLQHAIDTIDRQDFQHAAEMILDKSGNFYLCGFRTSYAMAQMFHIMIKRIRPKAFLIGPQIAMMPDMLMDIAPSDLLMAVFRYPYARQTVQIARQFAGVGAQILLITDSAFSPLADLATVQIVVSSEGLSIFRSFTAITAVLETLHLAVLRLCDHSLQERLEAAETLFKEFEIYWPQGAKAPTPASRKPNDR
jgi:DNA-binding MurR/RpiR family transcriptional regulator